METPPRRIRLREPSRVFYIQEQKEHRHTFPQAMAHPYRDILPGKHGHADGCPCRKVRVLRRARAVFTQRDTKEHES